MTSVSRIPSFLDTRPSILHDSRMHVTRAVGLAAGYWIAVTIASAQLTPPAAADSKPLTAVVEGKVVNQVTGAPLKKAVLTLSPTGGSLESNERGSPVSTETADDGSFRLPNVKPGPYWFMAERAGYAQQYFNGRRSDNRGSVIRSHAGEEITGLVFKLIPNAIISGKVLDPDGDPMRANVIVYRYAYRTSGKTIQALSSGSTGAMGEYSISVPPGKYLLAATIPQNALPTPSAAPTSGTASSEAPVLTYAPMFYPNSFEQTTTMEIPASAGADLRAMDFHMTKVKAYRVSGKVSTPNAMLQLVPKAGPSPSTPPQFGRVTEKGSFELPAVFPGTYYLTMNAPRGAAMIANQLIVVTDRHLDDLAVQFSPMPQLKGTVTFDGDSKLSTEGMQVGFDSFDNGTNPLSPVDKDGNFTINGILPGRYHPWAGLGAGGRYVKSIRYDGRDIKDTGLDITEGISGTVDVVMSPNAAHVSGVVLDDDGKPCAGVSVVLVPDSGAYLAHNSLTTDAQGHFDISYVRPGNYKLYALEDILYLAWFDKEYMKPYSSKAIPISVAENDKKTLSLKLIPVAKE